MIAWHFSPIPFMPFLSKFRLPQDPPAPERSRPVNGFYCFFGLEGGVPFDHDRSVTSPYIRPVYLGIIRLLFGVYMLVSFLVYFVILAHQKNKFLKRQAWKLLGDIMFHSYLGDGWIFLSLELSYFGLHLEETKSFVVVEKAVTTCTSHSSNICSHIPTLLYHHLFVLESTGITNMAYSYTDFMEDDHILHVQHFLFVDRLIPQRLPTSTMESSHHCNFVAWIVSGFPFDIACGNRRKGMDLHCFQIFIDN